MAERPPCGGENNSQVYNPQQLSGAVTSMMMVQQQQQQRPGQQQLQQRETPIRQQEQQILAGPYQQQLQQRATLIGQQEQQILAGSYQQQLQQRATPIGQQEQQILAGSYQQQLQQRATPVGQQEQQILAGPYQQQLYVHPMASEPSVNQGRPGPQGTTGAGTPHYSNMPMMQQQNMQESPPEGLSNSASTAESARNLENIVPSVAPVTNPVNSRYGVPQHVAPPVNDWYGVPQHVAPPLNDWYGVPERGTPVMNSVNYPPGMPPSVNPMRYPNNNPYGRPPSVTSAWYPINNPYTVPPGVAPAMNSVNNPYVPPSAAPSMDPHDLSDEANLNRWYNSLLYRGWMSARMEPGDYRKLCKTPPATKKQRKKSKHELPPKPDVEPEKKQKTVRQKVRQKANQVQTPYMGALSQQNLGASTSRQGAPVTSQQQQQQQEVQQQKANQVQTPYMEALPQQDLGASKQGVPLTSQQQQQQHVLHNQQQLTQECLGTPQQQAMARQTDGQKMPQNPGNTMLARASSTGAQMQGVPTQQTMYAMDETPQYQQPQQQAQPEMIPTTLATDNQARPGTPGAAAQPQNSIPESGPAATAAPTEPTTEDSEWWSCFYDV